MAASGSSVKSSADGSLHYLPKPDNAAIALSEKKSYKDIFMENPFVPVGLSVTLGALMYGVYQLRTGDSRMSQKMMRLRVGAQTFTVLAIVAGAQYAAWKSSSTSSP